MSARRSGSVPGRVHIVDDDANFAASMGRRLKHAGYKAIVNGSAQDLLDRLSNDSIPSCLLLDVQIPDLDGPALQTKLNELFLTGYTDIPATVRAVKAGATDFYRPTIFFRRLSGPLHIIKRLRTAGPFRPLSSIGKMCDFTTLPVAS
jgi:DNA-binding NtrC family response regulator